MTDLTKRVLERSPTGDYDFTPYGEFLSYYHAHLQIFNKLIQDKESGPQQKDAMYQSIKSYMVDNVKKVDHFFEQVNKFAVILEVHPEDLRQYLNNNFLDMLNRVQTKLKDQELEKLQNRSDFNSITEELLYKYGEIFPENCRFIVKDDLLVVQNMRTGDVVFKPGGIMGQINEEQKKLQEKLEQARAPKPKEPEYKPEVSILVELFNRHSDILTGEKLEIKEDFVQVKEEPVKEPPKKKETGLLDEVEDLSFEEDYQPQYQNTGLTQSFTSISAENEPGILDDIEFLDSKPKEEQPPEDDGSDLLDFLDSLKSETSTPKTEVEIPIEKPIVPEIKITPVAPVVPKEKPSSGIADSFDFKTYTEIMKKIQSFKTQNDTAGYNQWMSSASNLEKCFISIRTNINKEPGSPVDWDKLYASMEAKTEFNREDLIKLNKRIKHLDQTKKVLDIAISELKKQSAEVIALLKSAWPHILNTFGDAPDYEKVNKKLMHLLSRIPNEEQREPILKIINQAINTLKKSL